MIESPLYHYTDASGLCGILNSKRLWASSYRFLNDAKEFKYAFELISEAYPREIGLMPLGYNSFYTKKIQERKFLFNLDIVFLASFSEWGDQLSQWRGYAGPHSGYSIGFSSSFLNSFPKPYKLIKCDYEKDSQLKAVKKLLNKYLPEIRSSYIKAHPSKDKVDMDLYESYWNRVQKAAFKMLDLGNEFKDPGFTEEDEWRLVIGPIGATSDKIKYRPSSTNIVPYVEVKINPDKQPIQHIIIGPSPHQERSKVSLQQMLDVLNFKGIEVTTSEIPYINW